VTDGAPAVAGPSGAPAVAGWDRIATAALVRTAQAVAAEALHTPVAEVRARVTDDGSGGLAVSVQTPMSVPRLGTGDVPAEPIVQTAHRARGVIAARVGAITGRTVARVDVVFASSVIDRPKRVH
jgi:hypothetical protein